MVFDKPEDAQTFYMRYVRCVGFGIRKNHTRLSQSDKLLIGVDYTCSREWQPKQSNEGKTKSSKTNQSETKIGCKAMMSVSLRREEEKWVVTRFVTDHNHHELYTPRTTSLLRGHINITPAQKNLINVLNEAGIPATKIMSVLSHGSGGETNVGCALIDVQNHIVSIKNPGFVYSIQLDDNNRMGNCFWADTRSQLAYQYFGDVVAFDTTYLTNRYSMPFVPFTEVHHHHQSVMFGCALLVNVKPSSYVWLLRTWIEAMFGRAPSVIITDEDKSMRAAIAEVLPSTSHRLSHVFNKYPSFQGEFHHCIHDTMTTQEFEHEWTDLIQKYGLHENEWLTMLYGQREQWIPAYLQSMFCAGMSTTQRSESMNKFFKGFVRSTLDARYFKEKEKDLKTKNTKPVLKTCYKIEADAADVYTRKLFLMFQEELFSSKKYMSSKHCEDGVKKCYLVMLMGKEKPVYEVVLDPIEKNAIPSCHMFEFVGILCRYILAIFVKKSFVSSLLQQYILQRWTINSKSRALQENVDELKQEDSQISSTLRRNNLLIQFLEVVEEGQKSQRKHDYLALALRTTHSELLDLDDESNETRIHGGSAIEKQPQHSGQQLSNMPVTLLDPAHVSSKGRSKSLRLKHLMESQSGKKRKCSICKQTGHIKTSCSLHKQAS
ncbi:hypothetical protein MIMGU_mgv1a025010mg [Erythranthe guttata]|uniref:Protein FAR1-RELATED SEQUENCE n=1 Tax=Erythranthe guttata TaxID=4155 RepID=A0A022QK37_ERYGU|nr:hypothetical protein MIMGU_mgv1a025010mg [Erythranthe guttata]